MVESVATLAAAPRRDTASLVAGLTTVTLWGSAFVGIRAAGRALSPGSITLGRLLVSCAILTTVALVRHERLPARSAWLLTAVFGVLFLGGYSVTLNAAERHADAGTSAMIVNTGPLLIAVLAGVFLREDLPRRLLAGCCVALVGCLLIGLATTSSGASTSGFILLIVSTLLYASAVVVQKVALGRASAFQVTWLGCVAATVVSIPFAPALVSEASAGAVRAIVWTAYLGAMPTALGFATWSYALSRASAGRVAALNYLIPVVAILLGWAYLGERPPTLAVLGGGLCLVGVCVARRGRGRRRR